MIFSFLSIEEVTTDDSLSNVESDCFKDDCSSGCLHDNSTVAPPFSSVLFTENEFDLDSENPESN